MLPIGRQTLTSLLPSRRRHRRRQGRAVNSFRPQLEPLEQRTLLSADWGEFVKVVASDADDGDFLTNRSLAVSGDTFVAGARFDDDACPADPGCDSGSAYVFLRHGKEQAKLTASDAAAGDEFGSDVDIDGDTVVVGAVRHDGAGIDSGAAYVFVRTGVSWTQQAKLTASDAAPGDHFGETVALSGDTIAIGTPFDDDRGGNSGSVYVFRRDPSDNTWSQIAKLSASDGSLGDRLGSDVGIDGNTVVAGAFADRPSGIFSGSAYVFQDTSAGGDWSSVSETKLIASDGAERDFFGNDMAVSGNTVVVGASSKDGAEVNTGAVYVFQDTSGDWSTFSETKLTASDAEEGDAFGRGVAVDGDVLVVGASRDHNPETGEGSAYVFERAGGVWTETAKLTSKANAPFDFFGSNVALDGDTIVVGADLDWNQDAAASGSAYVFVRSPFANLAEANAAAEALLADLESLGLANGEGSTVEVKLQALLTQLGVDLPQDNSLTGLLDSFIAAVDRLLEQGQITEAQHDGLVLDALLLRVGIALLLEE